MKTQILAATTTLALALTAPAFAQSTADQGYDMLTGAIFNALTQMSLPTDSITALSLSEVAQITDLLNGDESEGTKRRRIEVILDRASTR